MVPANMQRNFNGVTIKGKMTFDAFSTRKFFTVNMNNASQ